MEISAVRKQVHDAIERAKRRAAERRARADEAEGAYARFLDQTATPLFRQIENVLRVEMHAFTVSTPGGSVRLQSDRHAEDFIEVSLNTSSEQPTVVLHSSRVRGRRIVESEHAIGDPATMTEEELLAAVLKELEPLVEK